VYYWNLFVVSGCKQLSQAVETGIFLSLNLKKKDMIHLGSFFFFARSGRGYVYKWLGDDGAQKHTTVKA
jgi:hypothetical protein